MNDILYGPNGEIIPIGDNKPVRGSADEPMRKLTDNPIYDAIRRDIETAFLHARRGKTKTYDEARFEDHLEENLQRLAEDVFTGNYHPSAGIAFVHVTEVSKVAREIYAAPFRDRVMHHYTCDKTMPWWDKMLDKASASCRKGKGTLYAIDQLAKNLRAATRNYSRPVHIYKGDIQGFFMSLPRQALYERARWGLERQFPDRPVLFYILDYLWREILLQDPTKSVRYKGKRSDWDVLPDSKILSKQPEGRGIVIGNLTSQLASNFYLDRMDRFIRYTLKMPYYGRYVDDFYIIYPADEEEQFLEKLAQLEEFLQSELLLKLHPKKCHIYTNPCEQGFPFLGRIIYAWRILAQKRLKKSYRCKMREFLYGLTGADAAWAYEGLLICCNGRKLVDDVYAQFDLDKSYQLSRRPKWMKLRK